MMDLIFFTVEEENLICAYDISSRTALVSGITDALPHFEETEMREIAENVLRKLDSLTDEEFANLTFHPAYHGDEENNETEE